MVHTCLVCKQDSEKPMQKLSQRFIANQIKNKMCIYKYNAYHFMCLKLL